MDEIWYYAEETKYKTRQSIRRDNAMTIVRNPENIQIDGTINNMICKCEIHRNSEDNDMNRE